MVRVWKLLALIAVLLMPFAMAPAPAAHQHHPSASMPMQHCPEQSPHHKGKLGFAECTMACSAALPAMEMPSDRFTSIGCDTAIWSPAHELRGLHPDTATPPPKRS